MNRRELVALGPLAFASAISANAQTPGRTYRLAVVSPTTTAADEFRQVVLPELARRGFAEGRNLAVTMHVGAFAQLPALGVEAVAARPDVVIASSSASVRAVLAASESVPIVMAFAGEDPVAAGFAQSFARPGGRVTGLTNQVTQLDGKRLSLLREAVPGARKIAILGTLSSESQTSVLEMERVALQLGVETEVFLVSGPADYPTAFGAMRAAGAEALALVSLALFLDDGPIIARLAIAAGLPTIAGSSAMARAGILIGYGPERLAFRRRAADYIVRILRGTPPGELPIEQPTTFEFAVNRKTAAALGIVLPPLLLAQADEVIE